MSDNENAALVEQVLSSYFSNNTVAPADLQSVIETVKTAFGHGLDPCGWRAREIGAGRLCEKVDHA